MRTENGIFIWVQWFDFSFGEEECTRLEDWRCWCTELRLEDSPQTFQNEIEKSLECATLVTAVELISV